jgi:hypothetical protein
MKNLKQLINEHIEREPPDDSLYFAKTNAKIDIANELNKSLAQYGLPTLIGSDMIEVTIAWRFKDDSGL